MLLEIGHFLAAYRKRKLLLLLQRLPFADQTVIERTSLVIAHEGVNSLTDGVHVGLVQNRLTKFPGLGEDGRFFDNGLHNRSLIQHRVRRKATGSLSMGAP